MTNRAALTGSIYAVLVPVSYALTGKTPSSSAKVDEVVDFYTDKADQTMFGAVLLAVAGVLLIFFVGTLRNHLRIAEGAAPGLSSVVHAGGS